MKKHLLVSALIQAGLVFGMVDLKSTNNSVNFLAIGTPSALKIRGVLTGNKIEGSCSLVEATFQCLGKINLNALDTGIDLRNKHMKETYLETAKYPTSTLVVNPISLEGTNTSSNFERKGAFTGDLTLHGTTRAIKGEYELRRESGKINSKFVFDISLAPFGIEIPSYLGIRVSKNVIVTVDVQQ